MDPPAITLSTRYGVHFILFSSVLFRFLISYYLLYFKLSSIISSLLFLIFQSIILLQSVSQSESITDSGRGLNRYYTFIPGCKHKQIEWQYRFVSSNWNPLVLDNIAFRSIISSPFDGQFGKLMTIFKVLDKRITLFLNIEKFHQTFFLFLK